jgi:hypothetical protein
VKASCYTYGMQSLAVDHLPEYATSWHVFAVRASRHFQMFWQAISP